MAPIENIYTNTENIEDKEIIDIHVAFGKREKKAFQEVGEQKAVLVEGIPQIEALCERHQAEFQMFCGSEKGFSVEILSTHNLLPRKNSSFNTSKE